MPKQMPSWLAGVRLVDVACEARYTLVELAEIPKHPRPHQDDILLLPEGTLAEFLRQTHRG
jgi:hypothetical protein